MGVKGLGNHALVPLEVQPVDQSALAGTAAGEIGTFDREPWFRHN